MNLHHRLHTILAITALAALLSACSAPPLPTPSLRQTVEQTSFIGACRGLDVGTYVFRFGPATDHKGSVQVTLPDPVKGTQTAGYSVTYTDDGQRLNVDLDPQWTGPFVRDAENLDWNALVGNPSRSGLCRMWEVGTATD